MALRYILQGEYYKFSYRRSRDKLDNYNYIVSGHVSGHVSGCPGRVGRARGVSIGARV